MYTAPLLVDLLARQSASRTPGLFKQGTFTLKWRAKVGSFLAPDNETLISAGEPHGHWKWSVRDFANVGDRPETLPLRCFIPGSSIRGVVRAWAKQRPEIRERMAVLLGEQREGNITRGKIDFLDAWPTSPTAPTLDVVTPQETFQVFHDDKPKPHSLYTFGDGLEEIEVAIAIRGRPGQATPEEISEVWQWVQQAVRSHGLGSRTATGYGVLSAPSDFEPAPELRKRPPGQKIGRFEFSLLSQGSCGADNKTPELRPTHWRGWLRGWLLRFLLGVMSPSDAKTTLAEIMGGLSDEGDRAIKGDLQLRLLPHKSEWHRRSRNSPYFSCWKGMVVLSGSANILQQVVLPVMKFASTVGGLGRGWRRPLHFYKGKSFPRGTQLFLNYKVARQPSVNWTLPLDPDDWTEVYEQWKRSVQVIWPGRVRTISAVSAEAFSPATCAVYTVPGPEQEPLDFGRLDWLEDRAGRARGEGLELIYRPKYKRKPSVGGVAASGGDSHCSWVSIRRVQQRHLTERTDCQEIVCLFMGKPDPLRQSFLQDLQLIQGSVRLFGL